MSGSRFQVIYHNQNIGLNYNDLYNTLYVEILYAKNTTSNVFIYPTLTIGFTDSSNFIISQSTAYNRIKLYKHKSE